MDRLEQFFAPFREQIVGYRQAFDGPYGEQRIVYADWTASGRLYAPIEKKLVETFGPFVGNTHSESSITGATMTQAYHLALEAIKRHVNAGPDDVIITDGFGMTTVVTRFQRILGLRLAEQLTSFCSIPAYSRPIVFVTHMEHHSNHTTWLETIADVEVIQPDQRGLIDLDHLAYLLDRYDSRPLKLGAFTACSNVTGIRTPYHELARLMHEHGGYCFVDFAASAPYVNIDMHPADPLERLDAIYFSPHKFLGGPGTSGVLIFDAKLYKNRVPDKPGGGTVNWTNPWKQHSFINNVEVRNIEAREDGGTPGFLQAIKAALAIKLKEQMTVERMLAREEELLPRLFKGLRDIPGLHILADHIEQRLGIFSFYIDNLHYNLLVKVLNDRFGIQSRGGCSCAGTYGHYLLHVDQQRSRAITSKIDQGDLSEKPGWVRISLHPTTTDAEVEYILHAIRETVKNIELWQRDYSYSQHTNEFRHVGAEQHRLPIHEWLQL